MGFGVIAAEGSRFRWVDSGVLEADEALPLPERVQILFESLSATLRIHRPSHVFLESLFHHKNARSALVLGHARGIAMLAGRLAGAVVEEISPAEVKQTVTGSGRADKTQVSEMVSLLLAKPKAFKVDESDALAIAMAGTIAMRSPVRAALLRESAKR